MAVIKEFTNYDGTEVIYPVTVAQAVYVNQNQTVAQALAAQETIADQTYVKKSGDTISGDLVLDASGTGETPAIVFKRGTDSDSYDDWRIVDNSSGAFKIQRRSGSATWNDVASFTNGQIAATTFSGNATTATTATTANNVQGIAGTANSDRHVWFSDTSPETKRNYDDDFKYNPQTNSLTVGSITGQADKNVLKTGDTMSGALYIANTANDTAGLASALESKSFKFGLHVGTGGTNHGIYDFKKSGWVLLGDAQHNWTFNGNATSATTAGALSHKSLNSTTLQNTSGTFAFSGSGAPWASTDWVGLQIGDSSDKFQITGNSTGIQWRQNDSGGTNSANWTDWKTVADSSNTQTGGTNGQIKIAGVDVPVKGLAALAYKDSLSKSDVGLGNVDNTSDANKPISTATQTALDDKQATITGGATTITSSNLTASRALISNASGKVAVSDVTSTELGYLDGVTSQIQTQLNGKQTSLGYTPVNKAGDTMTGRLSAPVLRSANVVYGICHARDSSSVKEVILYTGIKWIGSRNMPSVHIYGWAYNQSIIIDLTVAFYIYGTSMYTCNAVNNGALDPDIYLFKYTASGVDYVAIGLAKQCGYLMLNVDVQDELSGFSDSINLDASVWQFNFFNTTGNIPAVNTNGCKQVVYKANILNPSSVNSHTINSDVPANAVFTDTTYTFDTGDNNGQIKVTPSGGSAQNVQVKGLGSLAYMSSISASEVIDSVTGVKGNAESSYRTGNVNITPANIGAVNITSGFGQSLSSYAASNDNTIQGTVVKYSNQSATGKPTGTDHALFQMAYSDIWKTQLAQDWRTNKAYIRNCNNGTWGNWAEIYSTASKPTATDVGLGNVDNTQDLNKPISTATQAALDGKSPLAGSASLTTVANQLTFGDSKFQIITSSVAGGTNKAVGWYRLFKLGAHSSGTIYNHGGYNTGWPTNAVYAITTSHLIGSITQLAGRLKSIFNQVRIIRTSGGEYYLDAYQSCDYQSGGSMSAQFFTFVGACSTPVEALNPTSVIDDSTTPIATCEAKDLTNGFLPLAGGTMTGTLTAKPNVYTDSYTGALNMGNSNIYGVNSIYTADASENAGEGIHFYRDATHVDTLWMNGGDLLFVPNRALGTSTTKANSQKVGRFTSNPTTGQVVVTDGTTGGVKTTGFTIAASVPSDAVFTDTTALGSMTGTLSVGHGGTGVTTFTSGELLIGNGDSAIGTRTIKNMTTKGNLGWTSSTTDVYIPTINTLAYWNGRFNATAQNLTYCVKGEFGDLAVKNSLGKSDVGLGNVDNTSDVNKPISSATQSALDGKQATITGAATSITQSNLTASRALVSDSSGKVAASNVSSTELGYLSGVTSSIQTQLDAKQQTLDYTPVNKAGDTMTGTLIVDGGSTTARIWSGVNSSAVSHTIGADSNSGNIYLYATGNANGDGNRGLYANAHGTGSAKDIISVDTNNNVTFYGSLSGAAQSNVLKTGDTMSGDLRVDNRIWAGADSKEVETDVGARSKSGGIYLYQVGNADGNGNRGIWITSHGTGSGTSVIEVDTNNNTTFRGNLNGGASKVYSTLVNQNNGTANGGCIHFDTSFSNSSSGYYDLRHNDSLGFWYRGGKDSSSDGYAIFQIGNATSHVASNGTRGYIRLYGRGANFTHISTEANGANQGVTFPNCSGTVYTTGNLQFVLSGTTLTITTS